MSTRTSLGSVLIVNRFKIDWSVVVMAHTLMCAHACTALQYIYVYMAIAGLATKAHVPYCKKSLSIFRFNAL
ncbi:hypothetical protein F5148DRAFT_1234896, partial [Russula earlei]